MFVKCGKSPVAAAVAAAALMWSGASYANQQWTAMVQQLQPPLSNQDCVYFTLTGVSQADPVSAGSAWFAIPSTQTGFSEVYAALLAAKISGATVMVSTSGNFAGGACGNYAGVYYVVLQ